MSAGVRKRAESIVSGIEYFHCIYPLVLLTRIDQYQLNRNPGGVTLENSQYIYPTQGIDGYEAVILMEYADPFKYIFPIHPDLSGTRRVTGKMNSAGSQIRVHLHRNVIRVPARCYQKNQVDQQYDMYFPHLFKYSINGENQAGQPEVVFLLISYENKVKSRLFLNLSYLI